MKTEKELTEELELLYSQVIDETSGKLPPIVKGSRGYTDHLTHATGNGGKNGSDIASDRKQQGREKSIFLRMCVVGFMGILIIVASLFLLTPRLSDISPSLLNPPAFSAKTFRAPITAAPEEGPASHEITEVISEPDTNSRSANSEKLIAVIDDTQSDHITPLEDLKLTKEKATRPTPYLSDEKTYTIQIRALTTRHAAEAQVQEFIGKGFDAHWRKVTLSGGDVWYRIFIGHFPNIKDARAFRKILRTDDSLKDCFIRKL